jgi:5-methylcytosine-specific restriction endonuclease McrA
MRQEGRIVGEWVGKSPNAKVPRLVSLRRWQAADGCCQGCGRKIRPGERWDLDHIIALCNGGEHREANLQVLGIDICGCHKTKTKDDARLYTHIKRTSYNFVGIHKQRRITGWRKFDGTPVRVKRER